jgi:hypothetical protein
MNTFCHETKYGAARHLDWISRVMREDEYWAVKRRIIAPPTFPFVVGLFVANRPEHVPAHNPGSDIVKAACREKFVYARGLAGVPNHVLERLGWVKPSMQGFAPHTEWVINRLVWACAEAVE